jgi:DNA-directed RNA polymerase specialized sigma24 family protein
MGVETKTVDNAAFRARRKLRELMFQEIERDVTA